MKFPTTILAEKIQKADTALTGSFGTSPGYGPVGTVRNGAHNSKFVKRGHAGFQVDNSSSIFYTGSKTSNVSQKHIQHLQNLAPQCEACVHTCDKRAA